ncbi:hypothetical protein PY650_10125 [Rhizobium calliandrae]|uniref:Uncharacterized protein n=1 Tax=Rhizobium calliandrae TaxID=1312182 RepID=A0ABT7KBM9_9HYPH|nr:hypothetical protein [Rhizobium calliandrae]MDL2406015.1 hypothetical protein [Rhizobium calliandrae]
MLMAFILFDWNQKAMTEREKQIELDRLINILRDDGMPYPRMNGEPMTGATLDKTVSECRRLVSISRRSGPLIGSSQQRPLQPYSL